MSKLRIFVAGHNGMVGSAIVRQLAADENLELVVRSRQELDLTNQQQVSEFFSGQAIDQV